MENYMSLLYLVRLARDKYNNFLDQREICRGGVGYILLLLIFVASWTKAFRGVPFSIFLLNWVGVCNSSP